MVLPLVDRHQHTNGESRSIVKGIELCLLFGGCQFLSGSSEENKLELAAAALIWVAANAEEAASPKLLTATRGLGIRPEALL
jgi:hypothetical protein